MYKPIATARQLYFVLESIAESLQKYQPETHAELELSIKTRVVDVLISILEENGYPVTATIPSLMGRYFQGSMDYEVTLSYMFDKGDYSTARTAIQCILMEGSHE